MKFLRLKNTVDKYHKRRKKLENKWWDKLNYAQRFSVSSLFQFGYDINFVRTAEGRSVVVLSINDNDNVTVNHDGLIDTQPNIKIRQHLS